MTEVLFLDTDCLSTFLVVRRENLITQLYNGRIGVPQQVYMELRKAHFLRSIIDAMLNTSRVTLYNIDFGTEAGDLYLKLTTKPDKGFKIIGKGEAAAIALAKQHNGILGSNNMRDIVPYIQFYHLKHRTTADILVEALDQNLIKEGQGNAIWREMLEKNRRLPAETFSQFLASSK
jgi:predicted nucleic acid-binding protein